MGVITAPELLTLHHNVNSFDCGKYSLNHWLKNKAYKTQQIGGSARTYVACKEDKQVIGYYALSTGSIHRDLAPGKVKRNMPDPIPVVILGRLAVDSTFKSRGIGTGLLKDALTRVSTAAELIGIRAVLVHVIDESTKAFYKKYGFYESPTHEQTLLLTIKEIQKYLLGNR